MISTKPSHTHYNYYLSLENDLKVVSRFIEFDKKNLKTYSIELARILLAASSEVDVVLKQLCELLDSKKKAENINDYRSIIKEWCPDIVHEPAFINRYELEFRPWENWEKNTNPKWWFGYNKVKHQRNKYYSLASLENAINSIGALLIVTVYYYDYVLPEIPYSETPSDTIHRLKPEFPFVTLSEDYYS